MTKELRWSPYIESLRSLPFVRAVTLKATRDHSERAVAGILELTTPRGHRRLAVEEKRSHLGRAVVGDLIAHATARQTPPLILFAPYVSSEMAALLVMGGINFVDRAGNCHLNLGGNYVAHVEGRKARQPFDSPAGMRAPGFRLVFALLVEPELLNAPARDIARAAGVSLGTASNVLRRLEQDRVVVQTKSKRHLVRPDDLAQRWIAGYAETLRAQLFVGRYETPDADPAALENRVAQALGESDGWGWGGGAAAFRLTKHYRGEESVLHLDLALANLPKRFNAIPRRDGPLIVLGVPGPLAFRSRAPRTVHPLLVYTELILTGSERAREAATEIRERFLAPSTTSVLPAQ